MVSVHLIFYTCLELLFRMWRLLPCPQLPVSGARRILYSNVRCLSRNLSDLTVAYDLLLCSETLVSDRRHISELMAPAFGRRVLFYRDGMPRASRMATYVRDGYGAFRQSKFECGCCEMLIFYGVWC